MPTITERPAPTEHLEYYSKYIARVTENDAIAALESELADSLQLFRSIPESKGDYRYGPDKWSVKEVIGHLCDGERVFAYRALRFARKDDTPLPGFDEGTYVPAGAFHRRTVADLAAEYAAIRAADLAMFRSFDREAWLRSGDANGSTVSVRALGFIIAGHGRHHGELLKTRYLAG